MEDLKQQEQIINLGKSLVKELGLENGTDTLSRWMAHYLADKISIAEGLPDGAEKAHAQKECFEVILKLWANRWELPKGKRPLRSFEPILGVLRKINPEKENPFFYEQESLTMVTDIIPNSNETTQYLEIVAQIDKVARIWIDFCLQQATTKAKENGTEAILDNVPLTPLSYDIDAIQLLCEEENFVGRYKQDTFRKRIDELERFAKLNEFILEEYKRHFSEIVE